MTQIKTIDCTDREVKFTSFLPSPSQLLRNVNRVALPAIALFVASALQTADAGPVSWGVCIVACEAVAAASLIACVKACQVVFYLPCCP